MSVKKDIVWRVALVYIVTLLFGASILARIIYLQFIEVGTLSKKAAQLSIKNLEINPNRGGRPNNQFPVACTGIGITPAS